VKSAVSAGLRTLVRMLDAIVRRALGVSELSPNPRDLVRIRLTRARRDVLLPDATIHAGEPVLELHLWNEHLPPLPAAGADAGWAACVLTAFRASLREVAAQLRSPALAGVTALCASTSLLTLEDASLALMKHLGFTVLPAQRGPLGEFGEFWDNAYAWALIWAFNPSSLRQRSWKRVRRMEIWASRLSFVRRYGQGAPSLVSAIPVMG
jgi:hypothetical protein